MTSIHLKPLPLTGERFAPYGEVIEAAAGSSLEMNAARFARYDDLARVDVDGAAAISLARAVTATALPIRVAMLERHPLGSQAFFPLSAFRFIVVVAATADVATDRDIAAFITNGRQGINYRRGVWHMPLIALEPGQEFLVVDRSGPGNCEERVLDVHVTLSIEHTSTDGEGH